MTTGDAATAVEVQSTTKSPSRSRLILAVLLIAVTLRYTYVARNFVITNDSVEYLEAARRIEADGTGALKSIIRQPLYPLALWAAARLAAACDPSFAWRGGEMAEVGRWTSVALYPAFLIAAYLLLVTTVPPRAAPVTLLALAMHPLFGFYFANVLSETLYLTFFLLALWCLVRASTVAGTSRGATFAWGLAAGAATVLSYMTRVEGQIIAPAAISYFVVAAMNRRLHGDKVRARRHAYGALGFSAALLLPMVVFFLATGATSARYSWEWLYARLAGNDLSAAQAQLGTTPANAIRLLAKACMAHAPEITLVTIAALAYGALRGLTRRGVTWMQAGHGLLLSTCAWYLVAILVGVSIQNGVVSQRYIQPVAVTALPVAVAFAAALLPVSRLSKRIVTVIAAAACIAAFAGACGKWSEYKTGLRDAGLAISHAGGGRVLTSAPRVVFYADSGSRNVAEAELEPLILSGAASQYDYVVLEARRFQADSLAKIEEALSSQGFEVARNARFREDGRGSAAAREVVLYAKAPAAPALN